MPILKEHIHLRFREHLNKIRLQYNAEHDLGPDAPIRWDTMLLTEVLQDLIDILGNEPEEKTEIPAPDFSGEQFPDSMTIEQLLFFLHQDGIIITDQNDVEVRLNEQKLSLNTVLHFNKEAE